MARLTVFYGDEKKNIFRIRKDFVSIGRGSDCDLEIPASSISRKHATIKKSVAGYYLIDNHSTNGTIVNGREINEARLADGDEIYMGEAMLVFSYDEREYEETAREKPATGDAGDAEQPTPSSEPRRPARAYTTTKLQVVDLRKKIEKLETDRSGEPPESSDPT